MKRLIVDLDGTLTIDDPSLAYNLKQPNRDLIDKLCEYKTQGFEIVISTARNMRTFDGSVGRINVYTLPIILEWLTSNGVPFDEVIVGKPWCGEEGFYIDDRAVRPDEFISMTPEDIAVLLRGKNND